MKYSVASTKDIVRHLDEELTRMCVVFDREKNLDSKIVSCMADGLKELKKRNAEIVKNVSSEDVSDYAPSCSSQRFGL